MATRNIPILADHATRLAWRERLEPLGFSLVQAEKLQTDPQLLRDPMRILLVGPAPPRRAARLLKRLIARRGGERPRLIGLLDTRVDDLEGASGNGAADAWLEEQGIDDILSANSSDTVIKHRLTFLLDRAARTNGSATAEAVKLASESELISTIDEWRQREAKGSSLRHVVLFIADIDRFKRFQATFAPAQLDHLLLLAGQRIKKCVEQLVAGRRKLTKSHPRPASLTAFLGGDSYGIAIPGNFTVRSAARVAEEIMMSFEAPLQIRGEDIYLSVSLGIAIAPRHGEKGSVLVQSARSALQQAKSHAGGFNFFSSAVAASDRERMELEQRLRRAIEEDELRLYYQPQVEIESNRIVGFEALVRWDHPDFGLMSPSGFVSIAEDVGLSTDLAEWVVAHALRDAAKWKTDGQEWTPLSVNVSPGMLRDLEVATSILSLLREAGYPPSLLTLEVTEDVFLGEDATVPQVLRTLQDEGMRFAVDDFGTGYSSLGYLKAYPFQILKIDRLFIRDLQDGDNLAVVRAVIQMAKTLGLTVTAEGVETKTQLELLRGEKCDHFQGYLCAEPLPAGEVARFLESWPNLAEREHR